jgi:glyceraldehyde 3-phosphate dehydrogenase
MGRIGREYLRYTFASNDIEIVAVNDIADLARLVPLLRRDSTFGRFN